MGKIQRTIVTIDDWTIYADNETLGSTLILQGDRGNLEHPKQIIVSLTPKDLRDLVWVVTGLQNDIKVKKVMMDRVRLLLMDVPRMQETPLWALLAAGVSK